MVVILTNQEISYLVVDLFYDLVYFSYLYVSYEALWLYSLPMLSHSKKGGHAFIQSHTPSFSRCLLSYFRANALPLCSVLQVDAPISLIWSFSNLGLCYI